MARKLKVYGTGQPNHNGLHHLINGCSQVRAVFASTSWKKFSEALEKENCYMSVATLIKYGSVTANPEELKLCLDNPDQLYYRLEHTKYGYVNKYFHWDYIPTIEEVKELVKNRK
jgi:hypothetical protein